MLFNAVLFKEKIFLLSKMALVENGVMKAIGLDDVSIGVVGDEAGGYKVV